MKRRFAALPCKRRRYGDIIAHGDDEQAWTGLRHKQRRVDHQRAEAIAALGQRLVEPLPRFGDRARKYGISPVHC